MGKHRERTLAGYKWPDVGRDLGAKCVQLCAWEDAYFEIYIKDLK